MSREPDTTSRTPSENAEPSVEEIVERARQEARDRANQEIIQGVLAAGLTPVDFTSGASFRPPEGTELPGEPRRLLLLVEVSATRALGTRPLVPDAEAGEKPYCQVKALVRDLKGDGTPNAKRGEHWVPLPSELAPTLLGLAHTS